jgi:hypothetical protein
MINLVIFYLHIFKYKLCQITNYFRKTKHMQDIQSSNFVLRVQLNILKLKKNNIIKHINFIIKTIV